MAFLYAAIAVPCLLLALLIMGWPQAGGTRDLAGATFGHDLSQVWVAGRTALGGHAAAVYDDTQHDAAQMATFGPHAALFAWHYPPVYLLPAALLALIPYPAAVLLWGLGSVALIFLTLRAILGDARAALVGLAAPTVFDCLGYGQNGLLTASLLGCGLVLAKRRPWMAGAIIGLACYKPQLLGLVPLVMLATGSWRVACGAAVSALALIIASLVLFGPQPWLAFAQGLGGTDADIFRQGWAGFALNASTFGAMRLVGASAPLAWAVQIGVGLTAAALALKVWRMPAAAPLRNAVLMAAIPLVSPYLPVYDLALLVPAGAFLVAGAAAEGGLRPGERLALLPLLPIAFDPRSLSAATHLPFGFVLSLGVFALALRRATHDAAEPAAARAGLVQATA